MSDVENSPDQAPRPGAGQASEQILVNPKPETESAQPEVPAELPSKYQGLEMQQVIKMHQEAERKLSEQGLELGQLRKAVTENLKPSRQSEPPPEFDPDNPDPYIAHLVDEKLTPYTQVLQQQQQAQFMTELKSRHPDWEDVVKDNDFGNWVKDSKVRLQLFQQADSNYDLDSADELLRTWKQVSGRQDYVDQATNEAVEREKALRAAAVEQGGGGFGVERLYSRSELQALKQRNPDEYMRRAAEFRKAYEEGRVR